MICLYANKNQLEVKRGESLTSGSVNAYRVKFAFSRVWDSLTKTAVFQASGKPISVPMDSIGECMIPWEVLKTPGIRLEAGVYGTRDGDMVLPTVWTSLGVILEGVPAPEAGPSPPPTPGGEGGTNDHRSLTHRDAEQQHPITAIDGLAEELKRIPAPAEALTNEELEALLK